MSRISYRMHCRPQSAAASLQDHEFLWVIKHFKWQQEGCQRELLGVQTLASNARCRGIRCMDLKQGHDRLECGLLHVQSSYNSNAGAPSSHPQRSTVWQTTHAGSQNGGLVTLVARVCLRTSLSCWVFCIQLLCRHAAVKLRVDPELSPARHIMHGAEQLYTFIDLCIVVTLHGMAVAFSVATVCGGKRMASC